MQVSGTLDDRAKGYTFRNRQGGRTEFIVEMPNRYQNKKYSLIKPGFLRVT